MKHMIRYLELLLKEEEHSEHPYDARYYDGFKRAIVIILETARMFHKERLD